LLNNIIISTLGDPKMVPQAYWI